MASVHANVLLQLHQWATQPVSDNELLRRFAQQRDEAAFTALVRRHGAMVYHVCRHALGNSHDAEDAFQATFLVLATRAGAGPWRDSLAGWLHETARRRRIMTGARLIVEIRAVLTERSTPAYL